MLVVLVPHRSRIRSVKLEMERLGILDKLRKINAGAVAEIPCLSSEGTAKNLLAAWDVQVAPAPQGATATECKSTMSDVVYALLGNQALAESAPRRWSVYPPMVLFPAAAFDSNEWRAALNEHPDFFAKLASSGLFPSEITHFAANRPISANDRVRKPAIVPLYGDFGPAPTPESFEKPQPSDFAKAFWCTATQNGIVQTWAPRYTMFSRGNIKEKARVLGFKAEGVVADLYAGIGYFALLYAQTARVFCWEINPWLVEALRRNMVANGHSVRVVTRGSGMDDSGERCLVFFELNEHAPQRLGDMRLSHVNLGLLPLLRPLWLLVRRLCVDTVHVHENCAERDIAAVALEIGEALGDVLHVEKVKTFAPGVWHIVVDVRRTDIESCTRYDSRGDLESTNLASRNCRCPDAIVRQGPAAAPGVSPAVCCTRCRGDSDG